MISFDTLSQHKSTESCWMSLYNQVYDITDFLSSHPGGKAILLKYSGREATQAFEGIHSRDTLALLPRTALLGDLDMSSVPREALQEGLEESEDKKPEKPAVDRMLNVSDFLEVAKTQVNREALDYLNSAADDEVTLAENSKSFSRIWFRPRVLIDVSSVSTSCSLLGSPSSTPLFVSATAMGKLYHREGEVAITRAVGGEGVIQMCPTLASCSLDQMAAARVEGQTQWYQLYANKDRLVTEKIVRRAESLGMKALIVTVDAPQLGRRERDMRNKATKQAEMQKYQKEKIDRGTGVAKGLSSFLSPSLVWEDIAWLKTITGVPIVLKGIQCAEDALLAWKHGVSGIIISNHGGRQLEYSRPPVETLLEIMPVLRAVRADKSMEVYVDGGVRRGTDILKCLCLGAKAVGVGRPTVYALAAYGEEGVVRMVQLLKEELRNCMMLCGITSLDQVGPEYLDTTRAYIPAARM